jgi:hypothetical protein
MSIGTITVKLVETRKDLDAQFFNMSPAEIEYRNQNFIKSGKILFTKMEMSDDKLSRHLTTIFLNEASRLEYRNDPVITDFRLRKIEYNKNNNIVYDMNFDLE